MSRLRLPAACLALLMTGTALPALAQTAVVTDATQAPLALPRAQPTIPAPTQAAYPGVIRYEADITDVERRIVQVRQTIPVAAAGPLTLLYPKYLPGNHADTGPIQLVAGLTVTANGQRLEWVRDTLEPYAFHLDVPAGVSEIEVAFQWLTQPDASQWRITMGQQVVNLQWEKAILYPAGYASTGITVAPSVRMPAGWGYGVALDTETYADGLATFKPVDLYTLVDSPMFAGANQRRVDIDRTHGKVFLNIVSEDAKNLAETEAQLDYYSNLVDQTDRLLGARHYDR